MARFYLTTPIYYANDAPHVGTAYTTVNADALARWHRLIGDETKFLTGTDEHGQKVADAAAKNGQSPQEWTDLKSEQFRQAWAALDISYDDFIRTTEPRHYESVQKFLTAIYDNGYIYKDIYKGLYCVSCEDYYTIETSVNGNCPIHGRPLIEMEEENWFFRLSAFEDQLIEYYDAAPRLRDARDQAQRGAVVHQGRPARHLDHPHVDHVGRARAVGRRARLLRLVRRADQLPDRHWLRPRRRRGGQVVAALAPPHRQGDHPLPLRVVAGDVHGRGHRSGQPRPGARVAAVGGQKLVKTMAAEGEVRLTDIAPIELTNEFGVDPLRYYLLARDRARQRRRLLARGDPRALQHRPRQQPGQPRRARDDGRRHEVRRRRARRRATDSPLRAPAELAIAETRDGLERLRAPERARGDVATHRRDQRVPRTTGAVEDGAGRRTQRRDGRRARGDPTRGDPRHAGDALGL